jgi:hypothetical protein
MSPEFDDNSMIPVLNSCQIGRNNSVLNRAQIELHLFLALLLNSLDVQLINIFPSNHRITPNSHPKRKDRSSDFANMLDQVASYRPTSQARDYFLLHATRTCLDPPYHWSNNVNNIDSCENCFDPQWSSFVIGQSWSGL